jgi:fatty-acyl-CoA synthase
MRSGQWDKELTRNMAEQELAVVHGIPLEDEPGLGALTLPGFLAEVRGRYGPREALVMHRPGAEPMRWSYDGLWERSVEIARALIASGLGKGERVGILMTNRPEWLSSFFGIGLAGGTAVGLSTFSTPDELDALITASGISVLLFERSVVGKDFAAILKELEPVIAEAAPGSLASRRFPFLTRIVQLEEGPVSGAIESWAAFLAPGHAVDLALVDARAAMVQPADPGVLFFSSGSTGKPKGILNAHRGVNIQSWRWVRIYDFKPDIPVRTWAPNGLFWSGNFSIAVGGTFTAGGTLILQPTFVPEEAVGLMEAERVTLAYCWPHQWAQLEEVPGWDEADLSSLYYFEPGQNLRRTQKSISTPWIEPHATYGATETFTISAAYPCGSPEDLWKGCNGGALPGNTIKIVDPLTGETLRRGETGEIAVKGPTLMLGYVGIPNDEALDEDGFYHAGDGGFIDQRGRLVFQGRINDIIKTGGANVSPVEVDWTLCNCPGVKVCKTTGVPHDTLGEMVVSCVVREEGHGVSEADVIAYLKQRLAAYKVPRKVLFLDANDLDMTHTAKIKPEEAREFARRKLAQEADSGPG